MPEASPGSGGMSAGYPDLLSINELYTERNVT